MGEPADQDILHSVTKEALAARAEGHGPDTTVIADLLKRRYSCRGFLPRPVPRETIDDLLALSQLSASWCNSQPWELIVTQPAATETFRRAIRAHAEAASPTSDIAFPVGYFGVYKARQRECGWQLYDSVGIKLGDRVASQQQALKNFDLFGAPHLMIITTPADLGTYGAVDCGSFAAAFMLVAQSLGIATIAQAALAMHSDFLRRWFDIPEQRHVVCGISFGYADEAEPANGFRTYRADPTSIVRWVAG